MCLQRTKNHRQAKVLGTFEYGTVQIGSFKNRRSPKIPRLTQWWGLGRLRRPEIFFCRPPWAADGIDSWRDDVPPNLLKNADCVSPIKLWDIGEVERTAQRWRAIRRRIIDSECHMLAKLHDKSRPSPRHPTGNGLGRMAVEIIGLHRPCRCGLRVK